MDWFNDGTDFRLERYLASSTDICDLEHRQHKWSYMTESERNYWV
jgi:hypothetical protein